VHAIKLKLATKTLLNPLARQWDKVAAESVPLSGTPLHAQPSPYVRTSWATRSIGAVRHVTAQAVRNQDHAFFRLSWPDDTENSDYGDGTTFPDAAAVVFQLDDEAPIETLGQAGERVNAWYWRANQREGRGENLVAQGPATEAEARGPAILTKARWENGRWQLVMARTLRSTGADNVRLRTRSKVKVGVAIWEGSNQERAGLHSQSRDWRELRIE
jgi:complex iron-sulfur molybdoenzyme family reductase subunit gamma